MASWKSFRRKLQLARGLNLKDWVVLSGAWWVLLGFYLALKRVSLNRLEAFTHPQMNNMLVSADVLTWTRHRQKLISMAARLHLLPMTCLPRALALHWMASRHGILTQLRIGLAKSPAGISAHAWVEVQGVAVGEPEDIEERFVVLQGAE